MTALNTAFVEEAGITGLVGVRAIVYFAGRFYSPVYGHCEWTQGKQTASCAIGCATVPSDRHQGCGFHAHWEVDESKRFVEQISVPRMADNRSTETSLPTSAPFDARRAALPCPPPRNISPKMSPMLPLPRMSSKLKPPPLPLRAPNGERARL